MSVDVTGVFLCLNDELAHMGGRGAIVNTAFVAGLRADPGMAPCVAAKHAVVGLTKAAAIDYAAQGFRVNAIAPGPARRPMTEHWLDDPAMGFAARRNARISPLLHCFWRPTSPASSPGLSIPPMERVPRTDREQDTE
jgi:NAD(P)-dependent dehydrogenase (short-subunit alcohol dehydrogenase family)